MGSMTPFLDLNLYPDAINSYASASTDVRKPKIEPKLEPLDESLEPEADFLESPVFSNPNPIFSFNSHFDFPVSEVKSEPEPLARVQGGPNEGKHVNSEFDRISELFRMAFSQGKQKSSDVEVVDPNPGAIVAVPPPVPEDTQQLTSFVDSSQQQQRRKKRSSELVKIENLRHEDHAYYREVMRRTRMTFDSLRVWSVYAEEKRLGLGGRKPRGDLRAASVMRDRDLWLHRDKRIVGAIPGIDVGDLFFFRMELCVVGLHGQTQAGIDYVTKTQSANREPIATSVIVSGGYEDDVDGGDVIIYTGHGGQDKHSRQCVHQKLEGGNLALERSMVYGLEVRVIRGFRYEGSYSGKVYVYDGLYKITETWFDVGKSGFGVYKFKLIRMDNQPQMGSTVLRFAENLRMRPLTVRPLGYVCFDISMKREKRPVFLFNDIDSNHEPMYYEYIASSVFPPYVYHQGMNSGGCNCISGCSDDCLCASRNGGEFAYDYHGILVRGKPLIIECGPNCHCPPTCRNRVTQKGIGKRFEVFRSRETGWGVRSLDLIQAGAFVCEYAGVVLTREQVQIITMNGDDKLVYPHRFAKRWAEWGDISPVFTDYACPTYPSVPPLDFALDVSRMRNFASYMSHSSHPNVLVQLVLHDHNNLLFPHLMLFAMENIPPLREISLDYGMLDEWAARLPICN